MTAPVSGQVPATSLPPPPASASRPHVGRHSCEDSRGSAPQPSVLFGPRDYAAVHCVLPAPRARDRGDTGDTDHGGTRHVTAGKGAARLPPALPVLAGSKLGLGQKPRGDREQHGPGYRAPCQCSPPCSLRRGPCSARPARDVFGAFCSVHACMWQAHGSASWPRGRLSGPPAGTLHRGARPFPEPACQ